MNFDEYQKQAITTKMYPEGLAIPYVTLGLVGEAGEVAEKIKKVIRDENGVVSEEKKKELTKELGDVLWYIAAMADELGVPLSEIAKQNIEKLQSRKERGKLQGSGDNR
jgi:NTP pyrophosphatase (non-canonical NTP hydrolase)